MTPPHQTIAMWSGPRNLSTAMMYAFAQRPDCVVRDEPFYAAYLKHSGAPHPMAAEIMAAYDTDPQAVAHACVAPDPEGRPLVYQKHMALHMLPGFDLGWMAQVTNVFLIRHPARVIASYHRKHENPTLEDIGAARLVELYDHAERNSGAAPLVIDSADILEDPEAMLARLCTALNIWFTPQMLHWPKGGNAADGVWAAHWYGAVHRSTGLTGTEGDIPDVPAHLTGVLEEALPHYLTLKAKAMRKPEPSNRWDKVISPVK